jgi:hypothetical protein
MMRPSLFLRAAAWALDLAVVTVEDVAHWLDRSGL